MSAYDPNNVFAKILRGELPCHKIYEDEHTLAFLDIMPRADGHTLVIPKEPARNIFDISEAGLAATMATVRKLAPVIKNAMQADGMIIQQFNESAGGQVVFHLHVHLIPRLHRVALRPHSGEIAPTNELKTTAAKLSQMLG